MAPADREKQPHDVSGGAREPRTIRRSGPATGASMVGRLSDPTVCSGWKESKVRRGEDYTDLAARATSSSLIVFRPACIANSFDSFTRHAR